MKFFTKIATVLLVLSVTAGLFAATYNGRSSTINKEEFVDIKNQYTRHWTVSYDYESISNWLLPTEMIEEQFYLERIPAEYADAFLYYTTNRESMRPYFYALMVHESNNFTAFRHKNADGSYDEGPSQLNSKNIANAKFREWYNPKDESHITSRYCFYMVMTINFYWDLVNKYGYDYAFFAYNGGEKTVGMIKNGSSRNASLIKAVKAYDSSVRKIMDSVELDRQAYIRDIRDVHINDLKLASLSPSFKEYLQLFCNQDNLQQTYKLVDYDTTCYVRREDFLQFEVKEGVVVGETIIGTLNI